MRVGLFLAGIGTGVWDAAMNLEGAAVEQRLGKAIMPRFHAGFSFGTMAGAGVGALMAAFHVPVQAHLTAAVVLSLVGVLWCVRFFLPAGQVDHAVADSVEDATGADPPPRPGAGRRTAAARTRAGPSARGPSRARSSSASSCSPPRSPRARRTTG